MANLEAEKRTLGDELLEAGWRQGTLFSAPSAYFTWNALSDTNLEEVIIQKRKAEPKEKLILISQDCDIKSDVEPYVEAFLCRPEKQKFLSKVGPKSARWFVIDFDTGLVAQAKYRVQFAKPVLKLLTPEPWPGTSERLDQFVRWLARRYDRPALPDVLVEVFQYPVEQALARLFEEAPALGVAFNRSVHELRINLPASETPPFDLYTVMIVKSEGLTEDEANGIDAVTEAIRASLNKEVVHLDDVRILTEEMISMAEYYATRPVFLEYHTFKGEEIEGARPYGRA
jgi:hypothetical protein